MIELKAFDVGLGQYCEDGSPCVVAFDADRNPRLLNEKVYLKSESDKVIAHHKYKRCLAMAQKWRNYAAFCGMQSSCHNHRGFGKTAEKWTWKECHAWRCRKRWLELAKKFKEA